MDNRLLVVTEKKGSLYHNVKNSKTYVFALCYIIGIDQFVIIL